MDAPRFQPGFRLSAFDVAVLIVGGAAAAYVTTIHPWTGVLIGFVVLHFFLFCNVLRMSRPLELAWAAAFAGLSAAAALLGTPSWPVVVGVSTAVTVVLALIEIRRPSYHGVGWRTLNPGLPEWWEAASRTRA